VDDLAKLLALLDPRIVSAVNLMCVFYVMGELRKWRQERVDDRIKDAGDQGNDKIRDDRVTALASQYGALGNKVDALHARLDTLDRNNTIEMTKLTTELHFRLAAIDKRLGQTSDTTSLSS